MVSGIAVMALRGGLTFLVLAGGFLFLLGIAPFLDLHPLSALGLEGISYPELRRLGSNVTLFGAVPLFLFWPPRF